MCVQDAVDARARRAKRWTTREEEDGDGGERVLRWVMWERRIARRAESDGRGTVEDMAVFGCKML